MREEEKRFLKGFRQRKPVKIKEGKGQDNELYNSKRQTYSTD